MAKIYISYSHQDEELVNPYIELLRRDGHDLMYDKTILNPGDDFFETLSKALREADGFLVFLTTHSVTSVNVLDEIRSANELRNNLKFFIPLVYGEVNLPVIITRLHYIQFKGRQIGQVMNELGIAIERNMSTARIKQPDMPDISKEPSNTKRKSSRQREEIPRVEKEYQSFPVLSTGRINEVQKMLETLGFFKGPIDGKWGRVVPNAVSTFQESVNLPNTGAWDAETNAKTSSYHFDK